MELDVTDEEVDVIIDAYDFQRDVFNKLLADNVHRMQQKVRDSETRLRASETRLEDARVRSDKVNRVTEAGLEEMKKKKAEFDAIGSQLQSEDLSEADRDRLSNKLQHTLTELTTLGEEFKKRMSTL